MHLCLLALAFLVTESSADSRIRRSCAFATSSSDLKSKKDRPNRKYPKNHVVSRLKQAAERANAARIKDEKQQPAVFAKKAGSLRQLTMAIDARLLASRANRMVGSNQHVPARDSMTAIVIHNDRVEKSIPSLGIMTTIYKHVAIVFCKALIKDDLTIEHALRIQRLVRALEHENYKPDVICFIASNAAACGLDCALGYRYFRHLLPDDDHDAHLERTGDLQRLCTYIRNQYVKDWRDNIAPKRRTKLHVRFALFSSDYQLCILNDIHVRSPGKSILRALEWKTGSIFDNPVVLETSWTYACAITTGLRFSEYPVQFFYQKLVQESARTDSSSRKSTRRCGQL